LECLKYLKCLDCLTYLLLKKLKVILYNVLFLMPLSACGILPTANFFLMPHTSRLIPANWQLATAHFLLMPHASRLMPHAFFLPTGYCQPPTFSSCLLASRLMPSCLTPSSCQLLHFPNKNLTGISNLLFQAFSV